MKSYNPQKIEKKWQKIWEEKGVYKAEDPSTSSGQASQKPKYYCLIEFPYPSGDGLHVGHIRSNTAMDIIARKRRMEGYNVIYPIGWDAFGLPTENYAIKTGIHPQKVTKQNTDIFRKQLKALGFSFDWSREINTTDPNYYKWTQWIFLQLYKKGLAYKKKMAINWCPSCKTGLANEEVVNGNCERCGAVAEKKEKEQWMLAITKYADRLDKDLDKVDFLEKIKIQQRNWIGKSEGATIKFKIKSEKLKAEKFIEVFTTRVDTIFGCTYTVLAPEHKLMDELKDYIVNWNEVEKYRKKTEKETEIERVDATKEKTGIELKGIKAINPANNEKIPIFMANYVLAGYGTGAVMAVPAHDERDFEFAKKFGLSIRPVILKNHEKSRSFIMGTENISEEALISLGVEVIEKTNDGFLKVLIPFKKIEEYKKFIREKMTPGFWNEFSAKDGFYFIFKHKDGRIEEFKLNKKTNDTIDKYGMIFNDEKIKEKTENVYSWLAENNFYKDLLIHNDFGVLINSGKFNSIAGEEAKKVITKFVGGKTTINYKLRDWVFSRQRYWGEPIPMINCEKCGWQPVPEEDLPIELPDVKKYEPTDTGESPLANIPEWISVKCPKCDGEAKRETDTMPNWAGSSWYFLRYIDPKNKEKLADSEKLKYWMPVDWYNGGMEHTTLHLLYSRFWNKFLYDIGAVPCSEPYQKRTSHGMVLGEGGEKMSKSKGNVINPDNIIKAYGADTLRLYEMFMGPFDQAIPWSTDGLRGMDRFLRRVWKLQNNLAVQPLSNSTPKLENLLHKTIKKVTEDIEAMRFNTAISQLMILVNEMEKNNELGIRNYEILLRLLSPFAPHITEELWSVTQTNAEENAEECGSIFEQNWPTYDPEKIKDETFNLVVQINGKVRDSLEMTMWASKDEAERTVLEREIVKKWINGKEIKKIIFVPNKLINIVV